MKNKEDFYLRVKIAGMITFIPVFLAVFPFSGYLIGTLLEKKFGFAPYLSFIFIGIGVVGGIQESIKVIRLVIKLDKDSHGPDDKKVG